MAALPKHLRIAVVGGRDSRAIALVLDDDDFAPVSATARALILDDVVLHLLGKSALGG